jgi:phosphatidylserine decarboxylase
VIWIVAGATLLAVLMGWGLLRRENSTPVIAVAVWTIQGATFAAVILWLFYRDPERVIPKAADAVLSPADGTVIYVRRLDGGAPVRCEKNGTAMSLDEIRGTDLAQEALWQIGISMVFTDVHVNRAPVAGKISMVHHQPGKFLSLRRSDALNVNERQTTIIDEREGKFQVCLVQIASRLVRRIESYVSANQQVQRGQRIGIIKFGSQVDLFVPVRATASPLEVSEGQRLTAGESVICRISRSEACDL